MHNNMQNMQNNMQKIVQCSDSAYSAYCNMHNMQNMSNDMLQYAQHQRVDGLPLGIHHQCGQCIYITNMQNLNSALFHILILEFAYYFAYWRIYMQNNMYNMQTWNNMQKNSAMFRFCIFCILQYAQYAEYVK